LETNIRIIERYHEAKARRTGATRICATEGCHTLLSRYNTDKVCAGCAAKAATDNAKKMLQLFEDNLESE
jgi:hypothetical protein